MRPEHLHLNSSFSIYSSNRFLFFLASLITFVTGYAVVKESIPLLALLALIPAAAAGLYLLVNEPVWYWLLLLSAPLNDYLGVPLKFINLRLFILLSLIGYARFFWDLIQSDRGRSFNITRTYFWFFLLGLLIIFSKIMTIVTIEIFPPGMGRSFPLKYTIIASLLFALMVIFTVSIKTRSRLVLSFKVWIHLANVIALIAFLQILISNTTSLEYVWHRDISPIGRPYSVFREPDVLGSFSAAALMMLIPIWVSDLRGVFSRRYLWITFLIQSALILLAMVRASWIALLIALFLYVIAMAKTRHIEKIRNYFNVTVLTCLFGIMSLVILAPNAVAKIGDRIASLATPTEESASEYRMRELKQMVIHAWPFYGSRLDTSLLLFGHGDLSWSYWGPYLLGDAYDQDADKHASSSGVLVHPGFSMPLTIWHDNGVVGLLLNFIFYTSLIVFFYQSLKRTRNEIAQVFLMSTFFPIIVLLVCFIFSYDPISPFFFVQIGFFLSTLYHFYYKGDKEDVKIMKDRDLLLWIYEAPPLWRLESKTKRK